MSSSSMQYYVVHVHCLWQTATHFDALYLYLLCNIMQYMCCFQQIATGSCLNLWCNIMQCLFCLQQISTQVHVFIFHVLCSACAVFSRQLHGWFMSLSSVQYYVVHVLSSVDSKVCVFYLQCMCLIQQIARFVS